MNLLDQLTHLKPCNAPAAKAQPARAQAGKPAEPTLLKCGGQVLRDLFVPGHQGEKARVHSQYQLIKKLGLQQAVDGQAHSQDAISQAGRALSQVGHTVSHSAHRASAGAQEALSVARDYWRDEARTATGLRRVCVGVMQGSQSTAQGLFSTARLVARMGQKSADLNYRALKGEVNFKDLLAQGGEKALTLVEGGSRYLVSGRLPGDAKKFAKDCSDYSAEYARKVKNDPGLEVPKLLALLATGAAVGGGANRALKMAAKLAPVEAEVGALAAEEAAGAAPRLAGGASPRLAQPTAPAPAAAVVEEAAAATPRPGVVVPRNYALRGSVPIRATRPVPAPVAPAPPAPVAPPAIAPPTPLVPPRAPVMSPSAAPLPVAPAPVQLPPSSLPLPTRTPVCLPSSNYAPVPRGYLQQLETLNHAVNYVV